MATESKTRTEESRLATLREQYFVWFILLITAASYAGTLRFEFVFDDTPQIIENPLIRAWHYVPQYFFSPVWKQMGAFVLSNYYRPIFVLLMRINYALFAGRPLGWHVVSVIMHLLVTWLVYVLARKLTGEFTTAWLAALIFGVHPIHHEVVAWVSGTTESLFAITFLLAFLAYLRSLEGDKAKWMMVSLAFYVLAVLSKETAIVLPALVFAHGWIGYTPVEISRRPGFVARFRSAFVPASLYLPLAFLYLLARNRALSGLGHSIVHLTPLTWLLTLPSILLFYARNWFFPFRLSEFYDLFYQSSPSFAHVMLPAIILIALGAGAWISRNRLGAKDVDNAVAWIVIPLLPALDTVVFKSDELVHDRYFYLPSIGAAMFVALLIGRAFRSRSEVFGQPVHVIATAAALTVLLAFFTGWNVNYWRNDYALYSRAHQVAPLNSTALNDLAGALMIRNDLAGAQKLLETGYRNNPDNFLFPLGLGRLYFNKRDYQKAESYFLQAHAIEPIASDPFVLLGQIQLRQGHVKEALENMRSAAQLNPYSWSTHSIYGVVLAQSGDCAGADQEFEAALALNPGDALTQSQLARCQAKQSSALPAATKPGQP
jgi:tetratricopeptide (TPR) repeat protein